MSELPRRSPARHATTLRVLAGTMLLLAGLTACSGDAGSVAAPQTVVDSVYRDLSNPLLGTTFLVDAASPARVTVAAWQSSRPLDAVQIEKIASQPVARWFGGWNSDVRTDVAATMAAAQSAGTIPVLVAFNMPAGGCGGVSGGSGTTPAAYRTWIEQFAEGIGARRAVVILEPDALGGLDCLAAADQLARLELFRFAVQVLAARGSIALYLDAGNPRWRSASIMSTRLRDAGVGQARGFALNVANFLPTADNVTYGTALSALTGGKHFVIDTGRNGRGSNGEWCNPDGRALGERPTASTGIPLVDALLWVKSPGESDGACNGASTSGQWLPEYALGLAQRAAY